jgi:hypothetical protein
MTLEASSGQRCAQSPAMHCKDEPQDAGPDRWYLMRAIQTAGKSEQTKSEESK